MQDNRRQCSWALSWDSYRAWVCEAVQTIAREQTSIWGGTVASPQLAPLFRQASALAALGPGHLCISARLGDPCLASQDTSKNPPSPSGDLGLSCQGPATQTAPSGQGRNSERSRRVKESKYFLF